MSKDDALIGVQLDDYVLDQLLGHGGMGRVYRGRDVKLNRYVAIKIMDRPGKKADSYEKRFYQEARAIAKLNHSNIVSIYRINDVNDVYYMAMQYIDGADLRWVMQDYARNNELIDYVTMLAIMKQISDALDYAHQNGVIHRDIKPSNIMIARDGTAILTDFGLALDVDEGTAGDIFGSPHYIAPEQAVSSAQAVPQTDLYSLGVILFEMLTGSLPFAHGSVLQVAMAHIGDPIPDPLSLNPDLHKAFVPVLQKILEKEPINRYQTGLEFIKAVETAVETAQRDQSDPAISTLGRPKDRIMKQIQPVIAQVSVAKPPTKLAQAPGKRSFTRLIALLLLVVVLIVAVLYPGTGNFLNNLQDDLLPGFQDASRLYIKGDALVNFNREGASLEIYGLMLEIPESNPVFDALEKAGENNTTVAIEITGLYHANGDNLKLDSVDHARIAGEELETETD